MSQYIWVGLDVHIDSITAAILENDGNDAEVLKMSGDLMKVRRLLRRLSEKAPVQGTFYTECSNATASTAISSHPHSSHANWVTTEKQTDSTQ
jgi:hypothetical protein